MLLVSAGLLPAQEVRPFDSQEKLMRQTAADIKSGHEVYIALTIIDAFHHINVVMTSKELTVFLKNRVKMKKKAFNKVFSAVLAGQDSMDVNDFHYDYLQTFRIDPVFYDRIKNLQLPVVKDSFLQQGLIDTSLTKEMQNSVIYYLLLHLIEVFRDPNSGLPTLSSSR